MTVGFDRFLKRTWLDRALALAAADTPDARAFLDDYLKEEVAGDTSREKTVRRLAQIWLEPRRELMLLRDEGLRLDKGGQCSKAALHWGMCVAVYPFFGTVAEAVGRQLSLHENCALSLVLRRVHAVYGQRPTVKRATERVLQSMTDWGVLHRNSEGNYASGPTIVTGAEVSGWLVAALLHGSGGPSRPVDALIHDPVLFPFALSLFGQADVSSLQMHRQGGGRDVAVLVT